MDPEAVQIRAWDHLLEMVFGPVVPDAAEWIEFGAIKSILMVMGQVDGLARCHYPDGGSQPAGEFTPSGELGCLEMGCPPFGTQTRIMLLAPMRLTFRALVANEPEWSFFRLTSAPFQPSGVYEPQEIGRFEEVLETESGMYLPTDCFSFAPRGDGAPVMADARRVIRYFRGGDFLLVSEASPYNRHHGAIGGQHARMNDARLVEALLLWRQTLSETVLSEERVVSGGRGTSTLQEYEGKTLYESSSYEYGPLFVNVTPGTGGVMWSVCVLGETKPIASGGPCISRDGASQEAEGAAVFFIQRLGGLL